MIVQCKKCQKDFKTSPSVIKKGKGKFCSKKCYQPIFTHNCLICNESFRLNPAIIKRGMGKFCSQVCFGKWASKYLTGDKSNSWKGGGLKRKCLACNREFQFRAFSDKRPTRGKYCSRKCFKPFMKTWQIGHKSFVSHLINDKHHGWKGDKVGYHGIHKWVGNKLGKPASCEHCGKGGLTGRKIHWANKSHRYLRDLTDWLRLCVSCHKKYDLNFIKLLSHKIC